jgi:hypothetical protein
VSEPNTEAGKFVADVLRQPVSLAPSPRGNGGVWRLRRCAARAGLCFLCMGRSYVLDLAERTHGPLCAVPRGC